MLFWSNGSLDFGEGVILGSTTPTFEKDHGSRLVVCGKCQAVMEILDE